MNKASVLYIFFSIWSISAFSQNLYTPTWGAITVDANDEDWPISAQLYDHNYKVSYAFQEDAQFIYILFRCNYIPTLFKMAQGGLEVWVHPDGKKRKAYGFSHPIGGKSDKRGIQFDTQRIKLMHLFGDERGDILTDKNMLTSPFPLEFELKEDGYFIYEMAVPKEAFPKPKKNKGWQIGFSTPKADGASDMAMPSSFGTGMDPSMGGVVPGQFGGNTGPPPGVGASTDDPVLIWTKIEIK